ncbi:MFS transporter [uncultured Desulfobacter sp.]|uniref:MFS transporter n=1 Tax=uncultured Desulfobacter sp. TaxID=240139 RepID=UPI002AA70CEA|nr:MFS transporter [uncultured Desulfobacter sp.]
MAHIYNRQYIILALFFMVRTIPTIFFMMALPVILRLEGFSLDVIALLQLAGVPYLLKFLWAPLLDRGQFQKNHYKKWILGTGLGCGILLTGLGFLDLVHHFRAAVILIMVISVTTSTLDIAISALYIKLFSFEDRGAGSSTKIFGLNLGSILGSGFFLLVYNHFGWQVCITGIGVMILACLFALPWLKEPSQECRETNPFKWGGIFSFFSEPGMVRWTLLIVLNSLSSSAVFFMMKPFLVDQGVATDTIAFLVGFYGMSVAAIAAMAMGSQKFQKYLLQRRRAYIHSVGLSALAVGLFIPMALHPGLTFLLYPAVALINAAISLASVVSATLVMDFSRKDLASVDYALQMTGIHVGGLAMAAVSGLIVNKVGYPQFFAYLAIFAAVMIPVSLALFKGDWVKA